MHIKTIRFLPPRWSMPELWAVNFVYTRMQPQTFYLMWVLMNVNNLV